ncbi:hypothetical protein Fmac_010990 [Flemingia macrophylla]|uniref:Uncharacterized protein n=1 Tax=Flemingia macrophylla TaxID=520843 RepID=A0ABD1ML97_9FABA
MGCFCFGSRKKCNKHKSNRGLEDRLQTGSHLQQRHASNSRVRGGATAATKDGDMMILMAHATSVGTHAHHHGGGGGGCGGGGGGGCGGGGGGCGGGGC